MTETHQLADNTASAHRVPYMDRMPVSPLMLARAFSLSLSLSLFPFFLRRRETVTNAMQNHWLY